MSLSAIARNLERSLLPVLPRTLVLWVESWYFRRFGEPELALLPMLCRAHEDAIDVGGNEGCYSLFLRHLARRVHVFEPVPWMAALLRRKFAVEVTVHEEALSAEAGQAILRFPRQKRRAVTALASLAPSALPADAELDMINVVTAPLDQFAFDKVGLLKIDVEGHEEAVLAGARATIERCRPRLIVEIEERYAPGALARIAADFTGLQYRGFYYDQGQLQALADLTATELQPLNGATPGQAYIRNFIFIPNADLSSLHSAWPHLFAMKP